LQNEGFGLDVISRVMQEYQEIGFAKTVSKRVLGCMNKLTFQYEFQIMKKGGIEHIRILHLNKEINRTPMQALKYKHPIEALRNLLKSY
jgi:hypothetical protein